jgi:hypothetical protein
MAAAFDADDDGLLGMLLDRSWVMHLLVVAALLMANFMLALTADESGTLEVLRLLLLLYVIMQQLAANKLFLIKVGEGVGLRGMPLLLQQHSAAACMHTAFHATAA